ncbi:virulence RhuM family protein [bacterium]|nr:virulence RhuM family protein [bacterium]MBU1959381.1 virulence RhuM family protein [bacterium]
MSEIVIYEDGDISIEVSMDKETLWLNAEQIATVFDVNRPAIVKHIGNIYKVDELDKDSTRSILEQVAKDGKKRKMNFYNLDMIIATGYRVNSKKATAFRRWATTVLKEYLIEGYSLNQKRLNQKGLQEFNQAIALLQTSIQEDSLQCDEAIAQLKKELIQKGEASELFGREKVGWVLTHH